jgi:hypothetical protein
MPVPENSVTQLEDAFIRRQSHTSVSQVTQQLGGLSIKSGNVLPIRPAFGHVGTEIRLWANYFKLNTKPQSIYKYSLTVTYHLDAAEQDAQKERAKRENREFKPKVAKGTKLQRIITDALAQLRNARAATEFKAQVISLTQLELPTSNVVRVAYKEPTRHRDETWDVCFSKPIPTRLDSLVDYIGTMQDASGDAYFPKFPEELDVLGVIIGHTCKADPRVVSVGRGRIFGPHIVEQKTPMSDGSPLSILRGHFLSIRPATGRLLLHVNVTHGIFRTDREQLQGLFQRRNIEMRDDFQSSSTA